MYIYTYIYSMETRTETLNEYFDNRIAKIQSAMLGLAIGTPSIVIIVMEILMKTL